MAKKSTQSNSNFVNSLRNAERISDNVILAANGGWDYSFILFLAGVLRLAPEKVFNWEDRREAATYASWLTQETFKRIYRFKYSRAHDDVHEYIRSFLEDHQFGCLKRWIIQRIRLSRGHDYVAIRTNLLGRWADK